MLSTKFIQRLLSFIFAIASIIVPVSLAERINNPGLLILVGILLLYTAIVVLPAQDVILTLSNYFQRRYQKMSQQERFQPLAQLEQKRQDLATSNAEFRLKIQIEENEHEEQSILLLPLLDQLDEAHFSQLIMTLLPGVNAKLETVINNNPSTAGQFFAIDNETKREFAFHCHATKELVTLDDVLIFKDLNETEPEITPVYVTMHYFTAEVSRFAEGTNLTLWSRATLIKIFSELNRADFYFLKDWLVEQTK